MRESRTGDLARERELEAGEEGKRRGEQRGRDGLGGPRRHEHFGVRIVVEPVEAPLVVADGTAQFRDAGAGRVLVATAGEYRVGRGLRDLAWPVSVGEPLAKIDRAGGDRERG